MRKLLLGATALTAVTAVQSASAAEIADGLTLTATVRMEVVLSGSAEYTAADDSKAEANTKPTFRDDSTEVVLGYSTQTDDGYDLSINYEIPGTHGQDASEASIRVSKGAATLMFGADDGAVDELRIAIPSVGTGLGDGNGESAIVLSEAAVGHDLNLDGDSTDTTAISSGTAFSAGDSGDSLKVMFVYEQGPIAAAVSYSPTANANDEITYPFKTTNAAGAVGNDTSDEEGDNAIEVGVAYSGQQSGVDYTVGGSFYTASGAGEDNGADSTTIDATEDESQFSLAAQVETAGITAALGYVNFGNGGETTDATKDRVDSKTGFWLGATYAIPGMGVNVGANYMTSTAEYKQGTASTAELNDIEGTHMSFGVDTTLAAGIGASLEYVTAEVEWGDIKAESDVLLARLTAGF